VREIRRDLREEGRLSCGKKKPEKERLERQKNKVNLKDQFYRGDRSSPLNLSGGKANKKGIKHLARRRPSSRRGGSPRGEDPQKKKRDSATGKKK